MKEKDPHGLNQHTPGAKLDGDKIDATFILSFGRALMQVARVSEFGAKKYTRDGWLQVPDGHRRYTAALVRHVFAENKENFDKDSELLHAAHAAWNALARLELYLRQGSE